MQNKSFVIAFLVMLVSISFWLGRVSKKDVVAQVYMTSDTSTSSDKDEPNKDKKSEDMKNRDLSKSVGVKQNIKLKKGDIAIVPGWQWVDVVNQGSVPGVDEFDKHRTAGIEAGGTVKIIGFTDDGNEVLVRYTLPDGMNAFGTRGPSGMVFFLKSKEFAEMTGKYKQDEERKKQRDALVKKILDAE